MINKYAHLWNMSENLVIRDNLFVVQIIGKKWTEEKRAGKIHTNMHLNIEYMWSGDVIVCYFRCHWLFIQELQLVLKPSSVETERVVAVTNGQWKFSLMGVASGPVQKT